MSAPAWTVRRVQALDEAQIEALADVLIDCVEGGASVSFMLPLARERAVAFWRRVAQGVAAGERALLVAADEHGLCGTVQLVLDQPENQPHRADLSKMLVHRRARRQGLGAALMRAAEAVARECGKTLLVLDTASDDAERLYERLGWQRVGVIPGYALLPQGGLCDTTVYYRLLDAASVTRARRRRVSIRPHGTESVRWHANPPPRKRRAAAWRSGSRTRSSTISRACPRRSSRPIRSRVRRREGWRTSRPPRRPSRPAASRSRLV